MQRLTYGIKNSRIWHLCSQDMGVNEKITLDNWTRYKSQFREIYYLNDTIKFLEVDNFNHTFKFLPSTIRKQNVEDFTRFFGSYLGYKKI